MRIYTRTGDQGQTGTAGRKRVDKDSLRIEAGGTVDELNACLGLVRSLVGDVESLSVLERLQAELFELGADLSADKPEDSKITPQRVLALEKDIDRFTAELEPLRRFVLPGGTEAAARLHFARTVCRRAERRVVSLNKAEPVNPETLRYLNRLSDLLFTLARAANRRAGQNEILW
ncbi:MAG: cob(I)yrinic acid a,c-diamide adenosyltransferase [Armatimonadetes bacterium]|nr:cob(I)yrinic acid a,c-diamide adenosyltransferase [Armatimonadota bacterium]